MHGRLREEFEESFTRGALRSGADLPIQQLTRDAESANSRRRPFLRTFPAILLPCAAHLCLGSASSTAATILHPNALLPHQQTPPRPKLSLSPSRPRDTHLPSPTGSGTGRPRDTLLVHVRPEPARLVRCVRFEAEAHRRFLRFLQGRTALGTAAPCRGTFGGSYVTIGEWRCCGKTLRSVFPALHRDIGTHEDEFLPQLFLIQRLEF